MNAEAQAIINDLERSIEELRQENHRLRQVIADMTTEAVVLEYGHSHE